MDIQEITQRVERESVLLRQIMVEIEKVVVGQRNLVERLLIGLLCDGHLLLEGLPGLAKTTAVKTLAGAIRTTFQRIQFTPDLTQETPFYSSYTPEQLCTMKDQRGIGR